MPGCQRQQEEPVGDQDGLRHGGTVSWGPRRRRGSFALAGQTSVRHWAVLQTPGPAAVRRLTRGAVLRENRTGRRGYTARMDDQVSRPDSPRRSAVPLLLFGLLLTAGLVVTVLRFTGSLETARDRILLGPIAILFGAAGIVREPRNR